MINEEVGDGKPHQVIVEQTQMMGKPTTRTVTDEAGNETTQPYTPLEAKTVRYQIIREQMHQVEIEFWQITSTGERRTFSAFGGTPMLYLTKSGYWMHDEDAAKKSLTDAYTKAASWLGACADLFLGIFDDKYASVPDGAGAAPAQQGDSGNDGPPAKTPPSGNPDGSQGQSPNHANSTPDGW